MIKFISCSKRSPYMCETEIKLKINGRIRTFPRGSFCVHADRLTYNNWIVSDPRIRVVKLPDDLEAFKEEIEECINKNMFMGMCGCVYNKICPAM